MSPIRFCFALVPLALLFCQCKPTPPTVKAPELQRHNYQQAMMGTKLVITLYTDADNDGKKAATEAFQMASDVNKACSDYDATSELMKLNAAPAHKAARLSPILFEVLQSSIEIARSTNGAYDPTLGHHSYNWRMARKKGTLPTKEAITTAKEASGWQYLQLDTDTHSVTKTKERMRIDLGGIAKGYAATKMLEVLKKHGITRASITAGGEVRLGDPPPGTSGWQVSLKTLDAQHQLSPRTLTLADCAISTSGDLHQSINIDGQRYSHICDPQTGLGLTRRVSATVIHPDSSTADALATALCVQPDLKLADVALLVISEDDHQQLQSRKSAAWNQIIESR
ncbi:FAD:protein FMN transferase [Verrucomicrobiaceae bacterium N1E253]|uniref:FAD:protein FMN transferase n=1 Tax=Oceaniferula marina TaxID=2748318 RepID=A0A851GKY9_9BACT|nr:FAD:protein FMN transferase [Oceaniferula marina]NWK55390.1 FAD:protein FMN transferase [Oceaniferula marina]